MKRQNQKVHDLDENAFLEIKRIFIFLYFIFADENHELVVIVEICTKWHYLNHTEKDIVD